jgi:hypothetical protein
MIYGSEDFKITAVTSGEYDSGLNDFLCSSVPWNCTGRFVYTGPWFQQVW